MKDTARFLSVLLDMTRFLFIAMGNYVQLFKDKDDRHCRASGLNRRVVQVECSRS